MRHHKIIENQLTNLYSEVGLNLKNINIKTHNEKFFKNNPGSDDNTLVISFTVEDLEGELFELQHSLSDTGAGELEFEYKYIKPDSISTQYDYVNTNIENPRIKEIVGAFVKKGVLVVLTQIGKWPIKY